MCLQDPIISKCLTANDTFVLLLFFMNCRHITVEWSFFKIVFYNGIISRITFHFTIAIIIGYCQVFALITAAS